MWMVSTLIILVILILAVIGLGTVIEMYKAELTSLGHWLAYWALILLVGEITAHEVAEEKKWLIG